MKSNSKSTKNRRIKFQKINKNLMLNDDFDFDFDFFKKYIINNTSLIVLDFSRHR